MLLGRFLDRLTDRLSHAVMETDAMGTARYTSLPAIAVCRTGLFKRPGLLPTRPSLWAYRFRDYGAECLVSPVSVRGTAAMLGMMALHLLEEAESFAWMLIALVGGHACEDDDLVTWRRIGGAHRLTWPHVRGWLRVSRQHFDLRIVRPAERAEAADEARGSSPVLREALQEFFRDRLDALAFEHVTRGHAVEPPTTACFDCGAIVPVDATYTSKRDERCVCQGCFTKAEAGGRARLVTA